MALGTSRSATMSSGLLLDSLPSPSAEPPANGTTRFYPYASPKHHVTKARYITSNDPRGYIPVYEYHLNGQWIMLDMDDGYVLWTGIWKALGNSKADISKIVDSQPDLASQLRRVRGGYLKIQGTWMPYEIALRLSRRVAWPIRHDLIPLFGPNFPETCLSPDKPDYGQISRPGTGKRRTRRNPPSEMPSESRQDWTVFSPGDSGHPAMGPPSARSTFVVSHAFAAQSGRHLDVLDGQGHHGLSDSPVMLHVPYVERPHVSPTSSTSSGFFHARTGKHSPGPLDAAGVRYSPYPSPLSSTTSRFSASSQGGSAVDVSQTCSRPPVGLPGPAVEETIKLPPIRPPSSKISERQGFFALPPISSMDNECDEPMTVLQRLRSSDDDDAHARQLILADLARRRHSLTDAIHKPSEPAHSRTQTHAQAGARSPRTPLSAIALPSSSYRQLSRHEQRGPYSAIDPAARNSTAASILHDRGPTRGASSHEDRPARSVPTSAYLDEPSRSDGHLHVCGGARGGKWEDAAYVYASREDALTSPVSPRLSSGSSSSPSPGNSPSESRSGWRPW